jgi:hypothetical protein
MSDAPAKPKTRSPRKPLPRPPPSGQEVFTVREAAAYARVSPKKIKKWINDGLKHMRTAAPEDTPGPSGIIMLREFVYEWIEAHSTSYSAVVPREEKKKKSRTKGVAGSGPLPGGKWLKLPAVNDEADDDVHRAPPHLDPSHGRRTMGCRRAIRLGRGRLSRPQ